MEPALVNGKPVKGSSPGDYGFVYSAERPQPPPEVGWVDKDSEDDQKINLYSENVLQESDTTESVDRESIANLAGTKKQWELICSSHNSGQEEAPSKKSAPKWTVRLPYTEKINISPATQGSPNLETTESDINHANDEENMFKKREVTESAIEREIRLAHEREEMLRKEKEQQYKVTEKLKGQTIIVSYEAESESFHPAYNELAEADRGTGIWVVENRGRKEDNDDEINENNDAYSNESIIEKEIRLQREREADVARMRKSSTNTHQPEHHHQQHHEQHELSHEHHIKNEDKDINHNQKIITYEEAIANNSSKEESLIARELRELREREDELKNLRLSLHQNNSPDEVDGKFRSDLSSQPAADIPPNSKRSSQIEPPTAQSLWARDVSPFISEQRRQSADSTSSHGTGRPASDSVPSRRDIKVRPIADGSSEDEGEKPNYFEKQETPIEREMRLARERENELRRQKGLPEIDHKEENSFESYGVTPEPSTDRSLPRPRTTGQPSESMKKFASSRLQQELEQQKEREHELRSQGKVISTSEEHIQPNKYMEVAGVDKVDGTEKRNFVTKKASVSHNEVDSSGNSESSSAGQVTRKTSAAAAGGNMFSYKEFKQTAESKIEKELREMREREEELRMRRTSSSQAPQ